MSYVKYGFSRSCGPVYAPSSSTLEVTSSVYHSFEESEISIYHSRRGYVRKRPTEEAAVVILGTGCVAGIKIGGFGEEFLKSCRIIGSTSDMLRPSAAVLNSYRDVTANFRLVQLPLPYDFTASVPCPYLLEVKRLEERIESLPTYIDGGYRTIRICRYRLKACRVTYDYAFYVSVIFEGI